MQNLIITKLADLHAGDRILSWDGRPYRRRGSSRSVSATSERGVSRAYVS
ncbi:hypothetical protein [Microbacterium sp. bgisy207]